MQFKCDIWTDVSEQDALTGQFLRVWQFEQTVPCSIKSVGSQGRRGQADETMGKKFEQSSYLYIITNTKVIDSSRITNIRTKDDVVLYTELNGNETIFEVIGVTPEIDGAFGKLLGHKVLCNRSEVQEMDNG